MADLSHHQNVWECREPGCGALIPVLDGFGDAIVRFHRQAHVIAYLSEALEAERAVVAQLRAELAEALRLSSELRKAGIDAQMRLAQVMTAHGHAGTEGITVHLH